MNVVTSSAVVVSLVPVIAHAVAVFGDEQKATHWLSSPLEVLGNRTPAELMVNAEGIALVERTLTRIEHNIPS
jgi:putative toxin-antitoxin system antitoxin component (TIGR02293 family)